MSGTSAHPRHITEINPEEVDKLEQQLAGSVLWPGANGYDEARSIWNGMINRSPGLIVRPAGVADVMRTVEFARKHDLPPAIRSGGHNVAGLAVNDGGLMLDMRSMRSVRVDPVARTAHVEGGATWADFDRETGAFGLATTGGVISTTGVAGLTLGGGVGALVRKHGLSIDNLLSVDLVTADGEFITASESSHPELFWALRGGGGNFGVVTGFEFRLHPLSTVLAGMVAHPIDKARDVAEFYREFTSTAPEELMLYLGLMAEPESGQRIAGFAICYSGEDLDEGRRVLDPLLNFGSPVMSMVDVMPYPVWQGMNDPLFPYGRRYYWKGHMLREIPDGVIDSMVEYAIDPPVPWFNATIELYAGKMNSIDRSSTAYPHRDAHYQLLSVGASDDPADDQVSRDWAWQLYDVTEQYGTQKTFLNFNSLEEDERSERTRRTFGDSWERLVEVKRQYDPTNFFRENNNIDPDGV